MKRILLVTLTALLVFWNAEAQLQMDCDGNVGIDISPNSSYKLFVKGPTRIGNYSGQRIDIISDRIKFMAGYYGNLYFSASGEEQRLLPYITNYGYLGISGQQLYKIYSRYIYANGILLSSDERLKINLQPIDFPLERLLQVEGLKYDRILPTSDSLTESKKLEMQSLDKDNLGFLAQELQEVFPELVKYDKMEDDYRVDYIGMIPVLVEAIKEQQEMIQSLKIEVQSLIEDSNFKSASITTEIDDSVDNSENALKQNSPNPFYESTEIVFFLSESTNNAVINVYNMSGTQLSSIELHQRGKGSILINGREFDAGMYMYTMIADGKVVDTKQMILTD